MALAPAEIPEWKVAVIQDAPSEFAHQFMYSSGGFSLGNALGWVQIVDRMFGPAVERLPSSSARPSGPRSPRGGDTARG